MAEQFNESNFQSEVIESSVPVLVDFWAEWCGPCKMIGPLIDQLSGELDGQAKVGKVNVDEARNLSVKYGVKSIPLLLFFKDGEVKDQIVGANVTKEMLKQKLLALSRFRERPARELRPSSRSRGTFPFDDPPGPIPRRSGHAPSISQNPPSTCNPGMTSSASASLNSPTGRPPTTAA